MAEFFGLDSVKSYLFHQRMRLTVLRATLVQRNLFCSLPDPLVRVTVNVAEQCHYTDSCRKTTDPEWNQDFYLYLTDKDFITISVWKKGCKVKGTSSSIIGSICLNATNILRLRNRGVQRLQLREAIDSKQGLDILDCPTTGSEIVFSLSSPHPESHVMYKAPSFSISTHGGNHQQSPRTDTVVKDLPQNERILQTKEEILGRNRQREPNHQSSVSLPVTSAYQNDYGRTSRNIFAQNPKIARHRYNQYLPCTSFRRPSFGTGKGVDAIYRSPFRNGRSVASSSCLRTMANQDFGQKVKTFQRELMKLKLKAEICRILVSREKVFETSYLQVMKMKPEHLRQRLFVKFSGEAGVDYGGLTREWLHLLSSEMCNPCYGLFQYSTEENYALQINANSGINPTHLTYFRFVGRIIGMTILHGHFLNGEFNQLFYRQLLGKPVALEDIKTIDPELFQSLSWILVHDITNILENFFCVEDEIYGERKTYELKPGGKDIRVTEENKHEYVRLYVKWRFMHGVEKQILALRRGIFEIVPKFLLEAFNEREFELLLNGKDRIDIKDWMRNTRLKHCRPDSIIVEWFWKAVKQFDVDQRKRLLQFVTGSCRLPVQGFKSLRGCSRSTKPCPFTIQLQIDLDTNCLPKAKTCFNRIDLPHYETFEKLLGKLICAIEETNVFGIE